MAAMGTKGASPETARRIYRRLAKDLADCRARVEQRRSRPGYDAAKCLETDRLRMLESWLSGANPPVGVGKLVWRQVCEEMGGRER